VAIVDDEPSVCRSLARLLRAAGYRADTFASGTELLASQELSEIDCIFIDLQMPGPNGLEVSEQLRSNGFKMRLILMTASEEYENGLQSRAEDVVDAYLKKPLDSTLALQTIEKCMQRGDEPRG
jgi:FixJ family two-component response regulator